MRIAAPKEKVPITPMMMSGLVVPFLWAAVYVADRFVIFLRQPFLWAAECLAFLTAIAFLMALFFSPRDDIVSWERVPEARQRLIFYLACFLFAAGVIAMAMTGSHFWNYLDLALAVLSLAWLVLPFMVLGGNLPAMRLLLFLMRLGMVWWTSMFLLLILRDGTDSMMNGSLPAGALGFLGVSFWAFLKTARRLLAEEAGDWPPVAPFWQRRYWLCIALLLCLLLLWVLTGFTNAGEGQYAAMNEVTSFPFYDVAVLVEPAGFSTGPLLLLHAIPWQALLFPGASALGRQLHAVSALHWLGLACLTVAIWGAFAAVYAGMKPVLTRIYAALAGLLALAMAVQTLRVWQTFANQALNPDECKLLPGGMYSGSCAGSALQGLEQWIQMGQHWPTIITCGAVMAIAVFLLYGSLKKRTP